MTSRGTLVRRNTLSETAAPTEPPSQAFVIAGVLVAVGGGYPRLRRTGRLGVRLEKAGQEVLPRAGNILVGWATFDVSVSLYRPADIELRQGSRVICSSKQA
jgi:hypothetical protein